MSIDRTAKLNGLKHATYVLEQLAEGRLPPLTGDNFESDNQLLKIWMRFLLDIRWIARDNINTEDYIVTEKGKTCLANLEKQKSTYAAGKP